MRRLSLLVLLVALPAAVIGCLLLQDWQSQDAPDGLIPMPSGVPEVGPAAAPVALLPITTDDAGSSRAKPFVATEAPAPAPVEEPVLTEEERFEALYASTSIDELERAKDALWASLMAESNPLLEKQHEAGDYEYLGQHTDGVPFEIPKSARGKLSTYGFYSQEIHCTELRENEYPELYAKRRQYQWMHDEVQRQKSDLRQAKREQAAGGD